jgi:N-acetylmuramoyl-L-alanine amidase
MSFSFFKFKSPFLVVSFFCFFANLTQAAPLSIMIDPGHGGVDQGATRGSIKESQVCLKISQYLNALLQHDPKFKVSFTRTIDEQLSLVERVQLSKKNKIDLYVSIHANASTDPKAFGMELYFQNQMAPDEESLFLANAENENQIGLRSPSSTDNFQSTSDVDNIVEDLNRNYKVAQSFELTEHLFKSLPREVFGKYKNHALRQAPFYVISQTQVPSVLIEVGYLSNANDYAKLTNQDYQKKIAGFLYEGLVKHKEILDKERAKSLD